MTKEEKIKEAWGGSYGGEMDENGWKPLENAFVPGTMSVDVSPSGKFYRPISLRGVERNNGWIKIESESDLPKDILVDYYFYDFKVQERMKSLFINIKPVTLTALTTLYHKGLCTHYQPIEKPKPPIY